MKKIYSFVLILITISTTLSITASVLAADPTGTCKVTFSNPGGIGGSTLTPKEYPGMTDTECKTKYKNGVNIPGEGTVLNGSVMWNPDGYTVEVDTTLGVCEVRYTSSRVEKFPNLTKTQCEEKYKPGVGGVRIRTWNAPPPPASTPSTSTPSTEYKLLSPLPCEKGSDSCPEGVFEIFDPAAKGKEGRDNTALGDYLNIMIRIFIGICAVLAVMMVVIGGLEYMTSALPGNKEHGKDRINGAIFGLLLALGSWTLLNQINPNLLKTELTSLGGVEVEVEIMDEVETLASALDGDSPYASGDVKTNRCPEGIVKTASGAPACQRIAAQFDKMVADAKLQGIIISGYGYRSIANQTGLRVQNCKGNTTDRNPKPPCDPATALPGASNHNHGLAFDLRCTESGGTSKKIATKDNKCFVWLKANAGKPEYGGLRNLDSEPWHWSVDGK